jgi:hypothetical protein
VATLLSSAEAPDTLHAKPAPAQEDFACIASRLFEEGVDMAFGF